MGLIKDMFVLHMQAKEINRTWDPGTQMGQGVDRMRQMNQTLSVQAQAQHLAQSGLPATANIIDLVDTGTRLNFAPGPPARAAGRVR